VVGFRSVTNKFYTPGEQRAARVQALFDTIAMRYDLINDLQSFGLHRYWKRRLVRLSHGRPHERALDLCCGTGDVALALGRRGLDVVGLDFSEPMLAVAARRLELGQANCRADGTPAPTVRFLRGNSQQIPFPDATFHLVTISYGLRNLSDWEAGLDEMRRVLRPGGRVLVLDFGKPDHPLWRTIYFAYLGRCVPLLGRWFCGDPETHGYILESLKHYAAQQGVASKMRELQFEDVRIVNLMGGIMSINYAERPIANPAADTNPITTASRAAGTAPVADWKGAVSR
jgi:ubiquinone/menaquinone biosynthesis methyltransferase